MKSYKYLQLEDIKKISLEILKKVAKICDDNGFRYILAYGTLIGAIRHHGFIPWDDDIDIQMPRPDYERFLTYMETHHDELGNLRVFNRNNTKNYFYGITRVCNTDFEIHTNNERDCGMGIFIDVYPLDGVGRTYEEAVYRLIKANRVNLNYVTDSVIKVAYTGSIHERLRKAIVRMLGAKYYEKKIEEILQSCNYEESNYLGIASWLDVPQVYNKTVFDNRVKVSFEDTEFYAPKDYDYVLRLIYGDYMKLPPKEDQAPHHGYVAWKKA